MLIFRGLKFFIFLALIIFIFSISCNHFKATAYVQGEEDGVPSIKLWDKPNIVRNHAAPIYRLRSGKPVKILKTHKYHDSTTTYYLVYYKGEDGKMKGWVSEEFIVLQSEDLEMEPPESPEALPEVEIE